MTTKTFRQTIAAGILTTILVGLITTFFGMYTDVVNLKAREVSNKETLLEIKTDVKEIRNYLLKGE